MEKKHTLQPFRLHANKSSHLSYRNRLTLPVVPGNAYMSNLSVENTQKQFCLKLPQESRAKLRTVGSCISKLMGNREVGVIV